MSATVLMMMVDGQVIPTGFRRRWEGVPSRNDVIVLDDETRLIVEQVVWYLPEKLIVDTNVQQRVLLVCRGLPFVLDCYKPVSKPKRKAAKK